MDISKSKLQTIAGGKKAKPVKFGASTSSSTPQGKPTKTDYKKPGSQQVDFGIPSFGTTGLTGES